MYKQPDDRVDIKDLGMLIMGSKRFVINLRQGVPFNAVVEKEERRGFLRCWASHTPLTPRAAMLVNKFASFTEHNAFVWDPQVRKGSWAGSKGDHSLYKVILPLRIQPVAQKVQEAA